MGATKKQLKKALNYEARSVCILGIPLGILSGLLGIGITLRFIGPLMARWIHGEDGGEISLKISWAAVLAAVLIAWITVKLSVWIPARRLKPVSYTHLKELVLTNCQYVFGRILDEETLIVAVNCDENSGAELEVSVPAEGMAVSYTHLLSEGMILCAEDAEGNLALMTPEKPMPAGAEIC